MLTSNVKTPFLRRLQRACDLVGATLEVIPGAGNSGRLILPSGRVRYFHRLRWDLNTLGAAAIALDKDATAHLLKRSGFTVPTGRSFAAEGRPREARAIGPAYAYARRLGLPVLLKPNDSSGDQHVQVVYTRTQFYAAAREVFASSQKLLVQRIARGSDCSIVILDGEILMASEKTRPYVLGDGRSRIRELIAIRQRDGRAAGHESELEAGDVRIARHLAHRRQTLETIPARGRQIELLPCGNLGVGGDAREVTDVLHPTLQGLAIRAVGHLGLRIASLDLVLGRPADTAPGRCTILEVNAAPGLDTHEREPGWSHRRVDRVRRILIALDRSPEELTRGGIWQASQQREKGVPGMTVNEYLAAAPKDKRSALMKLRKTIKSAAPKATESISYGIVAFKHEGKPLLYIGYAKEHCALYGIDTSAAELKRYDVSKGTVRFPAAKPPPARLVTKIVKARIAAIEKAG